MNRPSRAIAYGIRAETSDEIISDPKIDVAIAPAMMLEAPAPSDRATTSVATDEAAGTPATSAGVST